MLKHTDYPVALLKFFLQILTPACASVSRYSPQEFYVYGTLVFLNTNLLSSKVIHGADSERWNLYNPLVNLCVQHDFVYKRWCEEHKM